MREYDAIADWYATRRDPRVGRDEVAALARALAPRARVLDLGCGDGRPLGAFLAAEGFSLFGIDSAPRMLSRFRARCPGARAACERIETSSFFGTSFDAVVAWAVLFHLSEADQRAVVARVARALAPGGRFLFTGAAEAGVTEGRMNGVVFRYRSLGAPGYRALLAASGLVLVDEHTDPWDNLVFLAARPPAG